MSAVTTIRERLSAAVELAREKEHEMMIERGATDEELAAFKAERDRVWAEWIDKTTADLARQLSDDRAPSGELQ